MFRVGGGGGEQFSKAVERPVVCGPSTSAVYCKPHAFCARLRPTSSPESGG